MNGDTPLHLLNSNPEKIKLLLEAGADYTIRNKEGLTPLDYYIKKGVGKEPIKMIDEFIKEKEKKIFEDKVIEIIESKVKNICLF